MDQQLARHRLAVHHGGARGADRDAGERADKAARPDEHPATAGQEDAHAVARAAIDPAVDPHRLPPVAVIVERRRALHGAVIVEISHRDAVRIRAVGPHRAAHVDEDGARARRRRAEVARIDAVGAVASCRNAVAAAGADPDVAATLARRKPGINAMGACALGLDGAGPQIDDDVPQAAARRLDAVGSGDLFGRVHLRALRDDAVVPGDDADVAVTAVS